MPDAPATELYGLPLSEFIPERDRRVKALRADKRRDEAKALAALRKPSVAAWAVNQLVRTQSKTIKKLFKAGDAIAKAQSGGKADALRKASGEQREAIDELLQAGEGLLNSDGQPPGAATLERVRETLRAASIDSDSRAKVAGGCLTQELQFAGLGIGEMPVAAADAPTQSATAASTAASSGRAREEEAAAERDRDRERKAALAAARKAETAARRRADRAEKALQAARKEHESAEAALKATEKSLAAATESAEQAGAELEQAERAVRDLDGPA